MATIKLVKLKTRRGTDSERKTITPDQGELVSTTDTKRLYLGTGILSGGVVVGSKVHPHVINTSSLTSIISEIGDLVFANNKFYQLTAIDYTNSNSWADVSTRIDPTLFNYTSTNSLSLNPNSIKSLYLDPTTITNGVKVSSGNLELDYNTKSLEISSLQLSLKAGGIDEREINSSALSYGLKGGSYDKLQVDIDSDYFVFDGNKLSLSAAPTTIKFSDLSAVWFGKGVIKSVGDQLIEASIDDNTIELNGSDQLTIKSSMFGSGLSYDTTNFLLSTTLTDVASSLARSSTGVVSLCDISASATVEWPKITVDQYGRVTNATSSIYGTLTGDSSQSTLNSTNSLSSIFNGNPSGINFGGTSITYFTALSSNGTTNVVVTLSSAGFITFEGNTTTRTGQTVRRFAIPIFAY